MKRYADITDSARADLLEIAEYVANHSPKAAVKLMNDFDRQFKLLAQQPFSGRSRNDIFINLRSWVFRQYVVFYVPSDDKIEIWHVLHSSRDIDGIIQRYFDSLSH